MLMLSMNIKKTRSSFLHLAYRTGLTIDLVDTPAIHNLTCKKYLTIFKLCSKFFKGLLHTRIFYLKQEFYKCVRCSCTDHVLCTSSSQDQLHGSKKNRFTGTGLTGKDVQSWSEFYFYVFDQGKILHMKMY